MPLTVTAVKLVPESMDAKMARVERMRALVVAHVKAENVKAETVKVPGKRGRAPGSHLTGEALAKFKVKIVENQAKREAFETLLSDHAESVKLLQPLYSLVSADPSVLSGEDLESYQTSLAEIGEMEAEILRRSGCTLLV